MKLCTLTLRNRRATWHPSPAGGRSEHEPFGSTSPGKLNSAVSSFPTLGSINLVVSSLSDGTLADCSPTSVDSLAMRLHHRIAMKRILRHLAIFSLVAASAAQAAFFVNIAPPAPVVETPPVAPGPSYVWVPGTYVWNGVAFVWVPGRWVLPPFPGAHWAPPRWVHHHHGWVFAEGHWR